MRLFLAYTSFKDDLIQFKCLVWNKNCKKKFDKKLKKKKIFKADKFCNHDNNKFILLLRKGVYPCGYMDDWAKFNETLLTEKEEFYSHLNMEDITEADFAHAKRVCKNFEIKNLGEYFDLYVQSNTLLLADVYEKLRKTCLIKYINLILQNFFQFQD